MARNRPMITRNTALRGLLSEISSTPLGAATSVLSVLIGVLQVWATFSGTSGGGGSSGGTTDSLGWIPEAVLPLRLAVFVVYATALGWSLGYLLTILLRHGRGRVPPGGYVLAIIWGLAQQASADWLFADERDDKAELYSILALAGLITAIWLARISMEASRGIGREHSGECARLLGVFLLSAIGCALLMEY